MMTMKSPHQTIALPSSVLLPPAKVPTMTAIVSPPSHRYHSHATGQPLLGPLPLSVPPLPVSLSLSVSADRRRLLDADGAPFLIQGDTCWSIVANQTLQGAIRYLDDRQAKGFNAMLINLIEHLFSSDPPRDLEGREPFLVKGDMSTPNDAYFDAASAMLEACARARLRRHPSPCYIGHRHDRGPHSRSISTAGTTRSSRPGPRAVAQYGEYLGRRFGRYRQPRLEHGRRLASGGDACGLNAIAHGIRSAGVKNLFTAHPAPGVLSPSNSFPAVDWLDVNMTYTYWNGCSRPARRLEAQADLALLPHGVRLMKGSITQASCRSGDRLTGRCCVAATVMSLAIIRFGRFGTIGRKRLTCLDPLPWTRGAYFRGLPWAEFIPDLHQDFLVGESANGAV